MPVHDEEENLRPLHEEVRAVLERLGLRAEILYVNDGSDDASGAVLDEIRAADARVRVLDHDRNHGLTAALDTGFRHARAPLIAMLDGDGQNPPAELEKLLAALSDVDLVIGWRRDRDDPWLKRVSSKIANRWSTSTRPWR